MERDSKVYLGDGAYAWFDGYQVWVEAERDGMLHQVALDPCTWQQLAAYVSRIYKKETPVE